MSFKMKTMFNKFEKEIHDMCENNKVDYERIDYLLKNGASANAVEVTEYDNGETDEDFAQMLKFLKEIRYDAAYTFLYSKRSGTPAATMENQVPQELKKERLHKLMDAQNEISLEINKSLLNKTVEVMVEGPSKTEPNVYTGHTRTNKIVLWEHKDEQIGDLVKVKITHPQTWVLKGELEA